LDTSASNTTSVARPQFGVTSVSPPDFRAVNLLMQRESRRQSCLKIDLFSGDGVLEIQKLGVQEISSIAREAGEIF